ncbi:ATP-binding protein [Methanococcus aeolicus]|uniref:4Fe-4S ferredoxin iron-sulfur binding domain protein n=1 Tax=Methanococcus aeolicus (strain ATCC BAA-1280 / DSM 17508 / OCM 812 / Nankai-3) TaxID=419665 RepID=A6UVM7_META3|nr:4Fe-4S dicluster domain-containing protein [Methanococcus aeolicus]ABR56549.1 4Fe-4S ferredoxin iron-sulfur binding domain protein [Methanococcus aeolicus Nankai-3]UXM84554.1 4Fe-4S dicluster domain-containing protein [Methanococcus aeolicus]
MKITKYKVEVIQDKCIGYEKCGLCIDACEENILIPDEETGKVKVNKDKEIHCDGVGSCLDVCPVDALNIIKEEVEIKEDEKKGGCGGSHAGHSCPSSVAKTFNRGANIESGAEGVEVNSELMNWPVQLHLLNPMAPYFKDAELAIVADCVPFAYANFHKKFLKGKVLAIGCPKLDDISGYSEKIRTIVKLNDIKKVDIVIMSVPCCSEMRKIVQKALEGLDCEINTYIISLDGKLIK